MNDNGFVPIVDCLAEATKDGAWSILDTGETVTAVVWTPQCGMWRFVVLNDDREPIDHGYVEDGTEFYTFKTTAGERDGLQ